MKFLMIAVLTCFSMNVFAQKQTFDIVSYTPPSGWTETKEDDKISYSRIDGGSWAQIAIYQHRNCDGDIQADFDKDWTELVAANKTISSPEKTEPKTAEGWTAMSGSGIWQYNNVNVASMLTVYSNGSVCIALLCNTTAKLYLNDYSALIGSLYLDAGNPTETSNNTNSPDNPSKDVVTPAENIQPNLSIAGLWTNYILETTGYSINNMPQYTSGYLRKEYVFNTDGTYTFRNKQWLTKAPDITFMYETGTYTVQGNQLILTPKNGKAGFWGKKSSTKEWGSLKKSSEYKLEKTIYTFEIINDPTYGNSIVLRSTGPTQRDGGKFNSANEPYEFRYSYRTLESSVDNPPGWKIQ